MPFKKLALIMAIYTIIFMLFTWIEPAHPATQYLRDGAAGNGSGDDWTNAFEDMSNIVWGAGGITRADPPDTLFVGDGAHTGDTFNLAEDAAKYVIIQKATADNHGTAVGWDAGYGDGVATFSATTNVLNIDTGYWKFNGVASSDTTGHGFVVHATGTDQAVMTCVDFTTADPDYITFEHIAFGLPNWDESDGAYIIRDSGELGDGVGSGSQHITISHCYFPEAYQHINTLFCDEWIVEYSYFCRNKGYQAYPTQTESWQAHGSDYMTIRYCKFVDCCGTGIIALKSNFAFPFVGWVIHNSLFYWSPGDPFTPTSCQNGIISDGIAVKEGNYVDSLIVYNNTFANMTGIPGVYISRPYNSGINNLVYNNIFFNPADASGPHAGVTADYNGYYFEAPANAEAHGVHLSVVPFTDSTTVDFTQAVGALSLDAGTNLGSPYDVDILGVDRPQGAAWDLGAYEHYAGAGGGPFYVKNGGNDALAGTSDATAWETVAKITGETFSPGDYILFKRGDEWRCTGGQLIVPSSGADGNNIHISSYGTGALPIINASLICTGWEDLKATLEDEQAFNDNLDVGATSWWFRNIYAADVFGTNGTEIRIEIEASTGGTTLVQGTSVGEQSGGTEDYASAPTRITWDSGADSTSIAASGSEWSDWVAYNWDNTKKHLIHTDVLNFSGTVYARRVAADSSFRDTNQGDETMVEDVGTVASALKTYCVTKLQIRYSTGTWFMPAVGSNTTQAQGMVLVNGSNTLTYNADSHALAENEYNHEVPDDTLFVRLLGSTDPADSLIETEDRYDSILSWGKDYITIENLHLTGGYQGITLQDDVDFVIVQDCSTSFTAEKGIKLAGDSAEVENCIVRGNNIRNVGGAVRPGLNCFGIQITSDADSASKHNEILNNTIYDCESGGVAVRHADSNTVAYNVYRGEGYGIFSVNNSDLNEFYYNIIDFEGNTGFRDAIKVQTGSLNNYFYNNVIYISGTEGADDKGLHIDATSTGTTVKNNIIYTTAQALRVEDGGEVDFVSDYNDFYVSGANMASWRGTDYASLALYQAASSQDANSIDDNPLFTDAGNDDFTLDLDPLSPCINTGVDVGLTEDYAGNSIVSEVDIGAYEQQHTVNAPTGFDTIAPADKDSTTQLYVEWAVNWSASIDSLTVWNTLDEWITKLGSVTDTETTFTGLSVDTEGAYYARVDSSVFHAESDPDSTFTLAEHATLFNYSIEGFTLNFGGNNNQATTVYAIRDSLSQKWVQDDGTLDTTADWETEATWEALTITELPNSEYFIYGIVSRNEDAVEGKYYWNVIEKGYR